MRTRFVLDESSWAGATAAPSEVLSRAVENLIARVDVARERGEGIAKHADYYATDLGDGQQLHSALFDQDCLVRFEHDLKEQLILALDRTMDFDDSDIAAYDATFAGSTRLAPGVAWAHAHCARRRQVAVLPLPLPRIPHGRVPVVVADTAMEIFFVTKESEHVGFFRSVMSLENADERTFEQLASSAFPALDWADGVWNGLGEFDQPYIAVRDRLVRCLGGLSDHGATCFHEHVGSRELSDILSARVGWPVSDENGRTKSHRPAEVDRTRPYRGTSMVFWWHAKLRPHVDRIYFRYQPPTPGGTPAGHVVVGIFKNHCILPN